MAENNSSVELESNEVALILGKDGTKMTVRIHAATEPREGDDVPEPFHVAVALAMRLLEDPEFHDDVLDWYEDQEEADDDEEGGDEEGEGEENDGEEDAEKNDSGNPRSKDDRKGS